jgi:hypothetical protein
MTEIHADFSAPATWVVLMTQGKEAYHTQNYDLAEDLFCRSIEGYLAAGKVELSVSKLIHWWATVLDQKGDRVEASLLFQMAHRARATINASDLDRIRFQSDLLNLIRARRECDAALLWSMAAQLDRINSDSLIGSNLQVV